MRVKAVLSAFAQVSKEMSALDKYFWGNWVCYRSKFRSKFLLTSVDFQFFNYS